MARMIKTKGKVTAAMRSVSDAVVKRSPKHKPQGIAKVFYKPADLGTDESDIVHILVPGFYEGSKIINPIRVNIGDSINKRLKGDGIVVTGVQIGKVRNLTRTGRIRETNAGRIILTIDRDPAFSVHDALKNIQTNIFPNVPLARPRFFASDANLPGDPTGAGPGPRPKPIPKPSPIPQPKSQLPKK
jgi:hypothetical protein